MKGNKIAIDRYLETGEVVDSLDLSVNYLVKSVKEGGTVPSKNTVVVYNTNTQEYTTYTDTLTVFNPTNYGIDSNNKYLYSINGSLFTSYTNCSDISPYYITSISASFEYFSNVIFTSNMFTSGMQFSNLIYLNLPKCKEFGADYMFKVEGNPTVLYLPECERLIGIGGSTLTKVILPKLTRIDNTLPSSIEEAYIGTNSSVVCVLDIYVPSSPTSFYVPPVLVDSYKSATNWSLIANNIKANPYSSIINLSITADNVTGSATRTLVRWSASYISSIPGTPSSTTTFSGTSVSNEFPRNMSTTDTVTIPISYEMDGLTATTTITQGVWEGTPSISIELTTDQGNKGWVVSRATPPEGYNMYNQAYIYGYQKAVCKLTFNGYYNCDIYIRHEGAERNYTAVSQINAVSYPSQVGDFLVTTQYNPQSGTTLEDYTRVSIVGLHDGDYVWVGHTREVDSSSNGWLLTPIEQEN